jgi:hypothetical protein
MKVADENGREVDRETAETDVGRGKRVSVKQILLSKLEGEPWVRSLPGGDG